LIAPSCGLTLARLAPKKKGGQAAQALGRSRGGFSTKIHVTVDGLGNPLRLCLTAGQESDLGQAVALVEGFAFDRLIADRGYAAQEFFEWVVAQEMEPVIPPHQRATGEKAKRPYDKWLYRERHLVECFINKIKHFRRVFSRYEKLAGRFLGFLQFVSSLIWLR
jgi:transposase